VTALFAVKAAVAATLALSILRAFAGPAPARLRPVLSLAGGFAGVVLYPVGVLAATAHHPVAASLLIVGAVELLCVAVWAARGPSDDGGEPRPPDGDGPIDWERFDRVRDEWDRVSRTR
jgi:hypothetical protein